MSPHTTGFRQGEFDGAPKDNLEPRAMPAVLGDGVELVCIDEGTGSAELRLGIGGHAVERAVSGQVVEMAKAVRAMAEREAADRTKEVYALERNPVTYEVTVTSRVEPEDLRRVTPEDIWNQSQRAIEPLKGKKIVEVGATYSGGGVAMIVPPKINLFNKSGIETHWFVMEGSEEEFRVTKDMHNMQQDQADPDVHFDAERIAKHQALGRRNFEHMNQQEGFQDADIYLIDDAQPAAMIPEIRKHYPNAMIVYRNHIQTHRDKIAKPGTEQERVQTYLSEVCGVGDADVYIAHPVEQFVPYGTPNVAFIPPISDPFEDLNRPLDAPEEAEQFASLERQFKIQNMERRLMNGGNTVDDQEPLDISRPYITLYARFDPAKGMDIGMDLEAKIIEKAEAKGVPAENIPQMLIIGNGSVDDPDRARILNQMFELRSTKHTDHKDMIKILGVEHNYALANAVMRRSMFALNPSTAEGFEHRATEAIIKDVPAIVSNRGGLPLQVEDGVSGFVMNFDDPEVLAAELDRVAEAVTDCVADPAKYRALVETTRQKSREFNERELSTMANVIRFGRALQGKGNRHWRLNDIAADMAQAA
jgi:glycosyltransferase involved in cell wall biosynthesis